MPEFGAEFFGRFLLAFAYPPAVDHDIVFVGHAVNADGTECEILETHDPSLSALYARARGPLIPAPFMPPENFLQPMPDVTPKDKSKKAIIGLLWGWHARNVRQFGAGRHPPVTR